MCTYMNQTECAHHRLQTHTDEGTEADDQSYRACPARTIVLRIILVTEELLQFRQLSLFSVSRSCAGTSGFRLGSSTSRRTINFSQGPRSIPACAARYSSISIFFELLTCNCCFSTCPRLCMLCRCLLDCIHHDRVCCRTSLRHGRFPNCIKRSRFIGRAR